MTKGAEKLPSYDELPDKRRYWNWGPPGSYEEGLGMLNLLTPEIVANAAKEIKTGERTGIGLQFHKVEHSNFGRKDFELTVKWCREGWSVDDEYSFNPQQSSQWDGLKHHPQMKDPKQSPSDDPKVLREQVVWYGGTTPDEVFNSDRIGIHNWAKQGIVGRGVLLDYAEYAKELGIEYKCFSDYTISVEDLQKVAERFNVKFLPGDILFFRMGVIEEWDAKTEDEKIAYAKLTPPQHAGLQVDEPLLKFLWNNHFSAIASDTVSVEVYPNKGSISLHQTCLAGWGMPFGELFDLDALSALCKKHDRYSFFFSSVPFNAVGGVSSAPNGVAIL